MAVVAVGATLALGSPLAAQTDSGDAAPLKFSVAAGLFGGPASGVWWDLPQTFAPTSGFETNRSWAEAYIAPKVTLDARFGSAQVFGALSAVGSYTFGSDPFDEGNQGQITLEEAFLGLRWGTKDGLAFEISAGAQPFKIGKGLLIADLGGDGFERGAMVLGPRRAAEFTAIARLSGSGFTGEVFYLDPNELASGDTGTTMAGAHLRYDLAEDQYFGLAYLHVLESTAPYVQAVAGPLPFAFITDGRDELNVLHAYGRIAPAPTSAPTLWVAGEVAYQWRDEIDLRAWAWSLEIGYTFAETRFTPTLSYAYRRFSGDDPASAQLERFDGLFYDGAPGTWAAGGSASLALYNSNVAYHRVRADFVLSPSDFMNVSYWRVNADQTNSPIQFGQATRVVAGYPFLTVGVPESHYSDDIYIEYTRILTPNLFISPAVAVTWPGEGLRASAGGRTDTWISAFVILTANF